MDVLLEALVIFVKCCINLAHNLVIKLFCGHYVQYNAHKEKCYV